MDRWSQLSIKDKSDLMSLYIKHGISSLEEIKKHYNSFADGGELYLGGDDPDLTPLNLSKMYANNTKYGDNRYIDTTMLREIDNYMISKKVGLPQRQAIAYTVQQEGNTTGSHGNGATGLVGWRGPRAANLSKTTKGQAAKLYDEVYGTFNADNWNHGGKGSGYKSGKAAQQAFKNATTATEAAKALNYGYVRPPLADRVSRASNVEKMFKATGGHLYQDEGPDDKENNQVKAPTWLEMWNHRNDEHYMTDKYSPQELDTLRRRLYANLLPYNYPLREFKKAMDNTNTSYDKNVYPAERLEYIPSVRSIEFRDEQWAKYLGIPKELQRNRKFGDHIALSEYKPTVSKENMQYYKIDGDDIAKKDVAANLVKLYNDFRTNKVLDEDGNPIRPTNNNNYNTVNSLVPISRSNYGKYLTQLGDFTVGSGIDTKRGQYVSYYDSWGLNPLKGASSRYPVLTKILKSSNKEDLTQGLGNPFEFYDRVYLDDYYNQSSRPDEGNYYGGWLPEINITTKNK